MRIKVDASNRSGTTGVIGNDLHYVDATGNLQETMRVDTDIADASDYTGFNITTNVTQTQQTGWGTGGSTVTGPDIPESGDTEWDNVDFILNAEDNQVGFDLFGAGQGNVPPVITSGDGRWGGNAWTFADGNIQRSNYPSILPP